MISCVPLGATLQLQRQGAKSHDIAAGGPDGEVRGGSGAMAKKKEQLDRISPGFYSDRSGALYVDMAEFLAEHGAPDTEAARSEAWQEIYRSVGPVEITEISD